MSRDIDADTAAQLIGTLSGNPIGVVRRGLAVTNPRLLPELPGCASRRLGKASRLVLDLDSSDHFLGLDEQVTERVHRGIKLSTCIDVSRSDPLHRGNVLLSCCDRRDQRVRILGPVNSVVDRRNMRSCGSDRGVMSPRRASEHLRDLAVEPGRSLRPHKLQLTTATTAREA